jgi:hypothetical protein
MTWLLIGRETEEHVWTSLHNALATMITKYCPIIRYGHLSLHSSYPHASDNKTSRLSEVSTVFAMYCSQLERCASRDSLHIIPQAERCLH